MGVMKIVTSLNSSGLFAEEPSPTSSGTPLPSTSSASPSDAPDPTQTTCHTGCNEISEHTSIAISCALIFFVLVFFVMHAFVRWNPSPARDIWRIHPRPTPAGERPPAWRRWGHDLPRVSASLTTLLARVHLSHEGRFRSNAAREGDVELQEGRDGRPHAGADQADDDAATTNASFASASPSTPDRRSDLDVEIARRSEDDGAGGSCTLGGSSVASSKKDGEDETRAEPGTTEDAGKASSTAETESVPNNVPTTALAPALDGLVHVLLVEEHSQVCYTSPESDKPERLYGTGDVGGTTCAMAPEHDAEVDTIGKGHQAVQ